ncbi:MAG: IS66 family transposase [Phycisphaerae bacterium]|nr:IS66 family transposase [Phycisphaerae bacterium]
MDAGISTDARIAKLITAALDGALTDAQAEQLAQVDRDLLKLAWLAAARRIAEQHQRIGELQAKLAGPPGIDPVTPSAQRPIYTKPPARKRKAKPGARKGHPGKRRPTPKRIDEHEAHRLDRCPGCGGALQRCTRKRTRTIEDILEDLRTVVTEHTVHRDYCPNCKKHVEPVVPDALPNAKIGHRAVALSSWLHYGLGVSISQVRELLGVPFQTHLSAGGLVAAWQRLAEVLEPWYVQIGDEARASAHLHADETGWRMNGRTWWLWCFANRLSCYYLLDPSRGSPALEKFFAEAFDGVLITDFWSAYNAFATERQCCLVHLLRELEKADEYNASAEWQAFAKKLRRLLRDGIRLRKRPDFSPRRYASRIERIDRRLVALAEASYADADATRLAKRLRKHTDALFTFLDYPDVPFDNNLAERMIRPAVILRKISQSNRSEKGAAVQAVLMSVYRTLKLRGHDPLATIDSALRTTLTAGQLPPLPVESVADG